MRLLSFGPCIGITVASGVVFLLGSGIASVTRATDVPIYSGECSIAVKGSQSVVATCGNTETIIGDVPPALVVALSSAAINATCRVYPTRGIFGGTKLDCASEES